MSKDKNIAASMTWGGIFRSATGNTNLNVDQFLSLERRTQVSLRYIERTWVLSSLKFIKMKLPLDSLGLSFFKYFLYNNNMFENDLKQLGLSDKEAKVYLAVLELGPSTAMQVSQKADINRPTAYVQIENLVKLGLMSSHTKGKKTYFAAEPPERLKELIRIRQIEIEDQDRRLKEILPELQALFDTAEERPKVRFYEGREGIFAIYDDMFKKGDKEILTFYPFDYYEKFFSKADREKFELIREKKRIIGRAIYTRSEGPFKTSPPPSIKDYFIPQEKFHFSATVDMYDNKVSSHSLRGKPLGVIIESQDISDTMRTIFDLAWEAAEKYQKKNSPA